MGPSQQQFTPRTVITRSAALTISEMLSDMLQLNTIYMEFSFHDHQNIIDIIKWPPHRTKSTYCQKRIFVMIDFDNNQCVRGRHMTLI